MLIRVLVVQDEDIAMATSLLIPQWVSSACQYD